MATFYIGQEHVGEDQVGIDSTPTPEPFRSIAPFDTPRSVKLRTVRESVPSSLALLTTPIAAVVPRTPLIHGRRSLASREFWDTPNLLTGTLSAPAQMPFQSTDFTIRQPLKRQPEHLFNSRLPELPAFMPFAGVEFGTRLMLDDRRRADLAFRPQIPEPAVTSPFVSVDWLAPRQVRLRAAEDTANLMAMLSAPVAPTIFRSPLIHRRPPVSRVQDFTAPNTLLSLLSQVQAQSPFVSVDWLPRARVRPPRPVLIVRDLQEDVAPPPFALYDWPRSPRSSAREDFIQQNLIGFVTYNYGTPFTMHEWSGKPRAHARKDFAAQNLLDLLAAAIQKPFFVTDWSTKQSLFIRKDIPAQNMLALLTAQAVAPFAQLDWSYPEFRSRRNASLAENLLPSLLQAIAGSPFVQTQWLSPRFRAHPKPEWSVDLLPSLLQFVAGTPFVQNDWTVRDRVRPRHREQSWDYNLALALSQYPPLEHLFAVLLHVSPVLRRDLSIAQTIPQRMTVAQQILRDPQI